MKTQPDRRVGMQLLRVGFVVAFVAAAMKPAQAELLARYTFESGTAADETANGLNGTLNGNAMIAADADPNRGMVLVLDGVDSNENSAFVNISDPTGMLNFGSTGPHQGSASVAAWVYSNDWLVHSSVLNQGEWRNGIGLSVKADSPAAGCTECSLWVGAEPFGTPSISVPANEAHRSDVGAPQGTWTHIASTWAYDPNAGTSGLGQTAITFYVNGVPTGFLEGGIMNGRVTPPIDNDNDGVGNTRIGAEWRDTTVANLRWVYSGRIDDVQIYDEALDQTGIEQAMSGNVGEPIIPGDTDGDGIPGEFPDDFDPIKMNFRKNVSMRSQGDLVRNGIVDFADFRQWKAAFLAGGGSLDGVDFNFTTTVPEPATAFMLVLAGCTLIGRGRIRFGSRPSS